LNNIKEINSNIIYSDKGKTSFDARLKGEYYELYCYNYILNNFYDINIIKSKVINDIDYGHFCYKDGGQLWYHSQSVFIGEFDALGIIGDKIYWWEISKDKINTRDRIRRTQRKMRLLKMIFEKYEIILTLIMPTNINGYENYNILTIEEPDYNEFISTRKFTFNEKINHLKTADILEHIAKPFNYIDEQIKYSNQLFNGTNCDIEYLKNANVIDYLYDINCIQENEFCYYDIENGKYGKINIDKDQFYFDGEKFRGINLKILRNYLKRVDYCT
jgi:hypothetical protein